MKDGYYLKCSCRNCGGHIEFPAAGEGTSVSCPHCGRPTRLLLDEPPAKVPTPRNSMVGVVAAIGCLLLASAGIFYFWHKKQQSVPVPEPIKVAVVHTNSPPPAPVHKPEAPVKPSRKKSPSDLKVSEVQLEKTKGSSLVYAVGTVTNDSDYQRFGVKIELDIFNKDGKKVATTQDYMAILEPRREWPFRALIPDSRAAAAKVATLKEEE